MATEQQLAQALSPYDPMYLDALAMGVSQPSLLGNTTKAPIKQTGGLGMMVNNPDSDSYYNFLPNEFLENETPADRESRMQGVNTLFSNIASAISPLSTMASSFFDTPFAGNIANALGGRQDPSLAEVSNAGTYAVGPGMQSMQDALAADTAAAQAQSISDQSNAGSTGYGTGDTSGGFGEGQYAHGGKVNSNHLKGPDPKGPDEGYGALQGGEFVVKKAAVKKYGEGLLNRINAA